MYTCAKRCYHENVIDHYENPRNVGSLDRKNPNVGTGVVGAPACIHEDTMIAVADGRRNISVKELYVENKIIPVWSYSITNNMYEIKNAVVIKHAVKKTMKKITFDDDSVIICTGDHKFLLKNNSYVEVDNINKNKSIVPFKRSTTRRGYWEIRKTTNRCEYVEIYKFHNPNTSLSGHNIHHIDFSKTNDSIGNLQYLTIEEHIRIHPPRKWTISKEIKSDITKDMISNAISNTNCRCETADMLRITHRELYDLLEYYEIEKKCKRKMTEDIKADISDRMKIKNPYSDFSEEQKLKFATHVGEDNGRFIKISNDELLKIGKKLIENNKKLTTAVWINFAKSQPNTIPQNIGCIKKRFHINTWNEFVEQCNDYNHKIKRVEDLEGEFDCYDLQVEENNNFAVITKETSNIQNGIILKNCGDVMKVQLQFNDAGVVVDAKFKTFGCGSAIAASSLGTEWVKGKTVDECLTISNKDIAFHLKLPPVKLHCSLLSEDAIRSAINDYKTKKITSHQK